MILNCPVWHFCRMNMSDRNVRTSIKVLSLHFSKLVLNPVDQLGPPNLISKHDGTPRHLQLLPHKNY